MKGREQEMILEGSGKGCGGGGRDTVDEAEARVHVSEGADTW